MPVGISEETTLLRLGMGMEGRDCRSACNIDKIMWSMGNTSFEICFGSKSGEQWPRSGTTATTRTGRERYWDCLISYSHQKAIVHNTGYTAKNQLQELRKEE